MSQKVITLIEHREGEVFDHNWGNLTLAHEVAQKLGAKTAALVLSHNPQPLVEKLKSKKIDEILVVKHAKLEKYSPDAYAFAIKKVISNDVKAVIFSHTSLGWDVAPKVAAALNLGLVSGVSSFSFEGEKPVFVRQVYNGKLSEKVTLESSPYLLTVERGSFSEIGEGGAPQVLELNMNLDEVNVRTKITGIVKAEKGGVDLTKSSIIISGGRGLLKKENFHLIEDLAKALGGDYAASRPVVDNEWVDRDRQVGSSGKTVSPKLYVACGISGAIQHLSGMKKSNVIVAINKDPEAPIFSIATYGIVGDLFEIIPALISEAKKQGISK